MKKSAYVLLAIIIFFTTVPLRSSAANQSNTAPLLKEIAIGSGTTKLLTEDGVLLSWGRTSDTIEGKNLTTIPNVIEGLNNITEVSASNTRAVALKKDGTLWSWRDSSLHIYHFTKRWYRMV